MTDTTTELTKTSDPPPLFGDTGSIIIAMEKSAEQLTLKTHGIKAITEARRAAKRLRLELEAQRVAKKAKPWELCKAIDKAAKNLQDRLTPIEQRLIAFEQEHETELERKREEKREALRVRTQARIDRMEAASCGIVIEKLEQLSDDEFEAYYATESAAAAERNRKLKEADDAKRAEQRAARMKKRIEMMEAIPFAIDVERLEEMSEDEFSVYYLDAVDEVRPMAEVVELTDENQQAVADAAELPSGAVQEVGAGDEIPRFEPKLTADDVDSIRKTVDDVCKATVEHHADGSWQIFIAGESRGHYRDAQVLAEHFALAVQEIDRLRASLNDARDACMEFADKNGKLQAQIENRDKQRGWT